MVSTPGYDPNALDEPGVYTKLATDNANSPLLNRATQGGYPPGSTMKVVTAAAALDSGKFTPDSTVDGKSPINISGTPLQNFSNTQYGPITLTTALTNSVNTVWAQVAEQLGNETMGDYMERFGFGSDPPLDYPDGQMRPSGVFDAKRNKIIAADSRQRRHRARRHRPGAAARDAAADGDGRGDGRQRRRADGAAPDQPDRRPGWAHGGADRPQAGRARHRRDERPRAHGDDEQRRARGHRRRRGARGHRGRRQDRHRRAEHRAAHQPAVVHRLRAARRPKVAIAVTVERVQGPQSQGGAVAAPIAKASCRSCCK